MKCLLGQFLAFPCRGHSNLSRGKAEQENTGKICLFQRYSWKGFQQCVSKASCEGRGFINKAWNAPPLPLTSINEIVEVHYTADAKNQSDSQKISRD
ncbi:hypothetical protein FKM82_008444 [Ascaphus truei]